MKVKEPINVTIKKGGFKRSIKIKDKSYYKMAIYFRLSKDQDINSMGVVDCLNIVQDNQLKRIEMEGWDVTEINLYMGRIWNKYNHLIIIVEYKR